MDAKITEHFASIIDFAQNTFEQLSYNTDITPQRAILNIQGKYGQWRIFITELFSDNIRKYRYYVLIDDYVEIGFDNSPDPRAIRLRYGKIGKKYSGKHIPHLHLENKTKMILTKEVTFKNFTSWLKSNLNCFIKIL